MPDTAQLLASGYAGNLSVLRQLQQLLGLTNEQAAEICLVSPHTYRRWLRDRKPNPTAIRLMAISAGYFPWIGWQGWEMHNGYLFAPSQSRHGITPSEVMSTYFLQQLNAEYKLRLTEFRHDQPQADVRQFKP